MALRGKRGTTGGSLGGSRFKVRQRTRELNTGYCPVCSSVKGEPCRSMKPGGPAFLNRTHSSAPEPDWKKLNRKKADTQAKERAAELAKMEEPDAFVPKNLRGAAKGTNGRLTATDGWTRDSWRS